MSRRGARLTIAVLFALACGAATWQYLRVERALSLQVDGAITFERDARTFATAVADLRGAQQAYVAAGQGIDFWTARVASGISALRGRLDALRSTAANTGVIPRLDAVSAALDEFTRIDRRAREYAVADQRLLASDLIFGDGFELTRAIAADIEAARDAEASFRSVLERRLRAEQRLLAGGVSGLALLFLLILAIAPTPPNRPYAAEPRSTRPQEPEPERDPEPRQLLRLDNTSSEASPASLLVPGSLRAVSGYGEARSLVPAPAVNLSDAAELCADLAQVSNTAEIPALLGRITHVLGANGIVLWMADPDGRELVPTVAHGYPVASIARLGTIRRDADNATAAAYREARAHTVKGDTLTSGAVVVPLLTPRGCVGVMAAEIRHDREERDEVRALASIVAAQLATLVGVAPVAHAHAKAN